MLNCKQEVETRVEWIKNLLKTTGAKGIVYGNSGGKDCTLVGILSKMATDNVTGIIMPCESSRNFGIDREHAILVGEKYGIPQIEIDLTPVKQAFRNVLSDSIGDCAMAYANINPRLRMTTLYAYAYKNNLLVAGAGSAILSAQPQYRMQRASRQPRIRFMRVTSSFVLPLSYHRSPRRAAQNGSLLFFLEEKKQKKIKCGAVGSLFSCCLRQRVTQNGRFTYEPSVFSLQAGCKKTVFPAKENLPRSCLLFLFFK